MSLLKKMAQLAIRKAFVSKVVAQSPAGIKSQVEQIGGDAALVDALYRYATQESKQEGKYPLTPALVAEMGLTVPQTELLCGDPAVLAYLNTLLKQETT